jgi:hypothetical protein
MSLIDVDLKFALEKPGCPICTLREKAERRYIGSMLHEYVNDGETRHHIILSLGYCPEHIWQTGALEVELQGDPLGNTIIYEHLVRVTAGRLRHYADRAWQRSFPRWRRWLGRLWPPLVRVPAPDELQPQARCRVCQSGDSTARSHLHWLLEALSIADDGFRELYARSEGLCLPHLRQALETAAWEDRTGVEFLIAGAFSRLNRLQHDLAEYSRKRSWQFRDEPKTAGELNSWLRAISFFGGNQGGECQGQPVIKAGKANPE